MNVSQKTIEIFDSYRKIRNKIVYEAAKVSEEKTKEALIFAKDFIKLMRSMSEKM